MSSLPPCDAACELLKILLDNQGNASRLNTWLTDVEHLHQCNREGTAKIPDALVPLLPKITENTQKIHDLVKENRALWRQGHGATP